MALSGTISKKITGREYRIEWSAKQDTADNSSTITCTHKLINDAYYSLYINSRTVSCNVGGVTGTATSPEISTGGGSTITLGTTTHKVTHDSDGKKENVPITGVFYIQATLSGTYTDSITASGAVTLDTIARASVPTVSAASVTMGNSVTITTNRKSDSFTHDLTYSFGGSTGTIATGVGASYAWTVPDLVSKIPNKASGTCTITCKTKNGTTVIGTNTVTLTLKIPEQSTVSALDGKMGKSLTIKVNRNSSSFTHTLTYAIGDKSNQSIGTGVTTSKTWTPAKSHAWDTGGKTKATCTITCVTYNGTYKVGSDTTKITLTVPDATVPTLSSTTPTWGDKITFSMPRETDAYEHDLYYTLTAKGSNTVVDSGTFATGIGTSAEWADGPSYAKKIPAATQGVFTITCTTKLSYGDKATVGSNSVSYTETVPNNATTQPKITGMTTEPVNEGLNAKFSGLYVQGKSKVKVTYTYSSDYSTFPNTPCSTYLSGYGGTTNPYTSKVLTSYGNVAIAGTVTDSRGYSTTKTTSITVIDYQRPMIIPGSGKSKIICTRCNSNGAIDPGGVYLLIQIGRKYSKVISNGTQKNFCKLSYRWKTDAQSDSQYSAPVELLAKTATSDYVEQRISGVVTSNITAYNIQLIAEDDIGETEVVTITVPTLFATWHVPVGGHGFTLGGYHDPSKYNVFDCQFDAEFQGNVTGSVIGLGKVPSISATEDINNYKNFGVYSVGTNEGAATIGNLPVTKAGTLRVWSGVGNGLNSGAHAFIIQEYNVYDNSGIYRRCIRSNASEEWIYEEWKTIFSG